MRSSSADSSRVASSLTGRLRGWLCLGVVALLVVGCGQPDPPRSEPVEPGPIQTSSTSAGSGTETAPDPSSEPDPAATSDSAASTSDPTDVTGVPGDPETLVDGLSVPWSLAFLPDGSALVSLREEARVVRVSPDGEVTDVPYTGPEGTVPGTQPRGEGGLLGLALSPDFETDSLVYAYLTAEDENRVVRMELDGDRLGEPETVLDGITANSTHNGGRIAFGPDGFLYVATGDAQERDSSQDVEDLNGKILRITPDGEPAPGNPFPGSPVWTLGHRNVQGLGWDADGRMYASEFGQNRLDELNLIEAGNNYGWPIVEGGGGEPEFVDPLVTWAPEEASPSGIAVTGDAVYLAALRGQRLWRVPLSDGQVGTPEALLQGDFGRLRDAEIAPDGSMWVITDNASRGDAGSDQIIRLTFD